MKTTSGSITTENLDPSGVATANSAVELMGLTDEGALTVQVTGTYTGALTLQGRANSDVWVSLSGLTDLSNGITVATIASGTAGIFRADCSGLVAVRISANEAVTGTAKLVLRAGAIAPSVTDVSVSLEAGDVQIGAVEIKDATTDNRQTVAADGRAATDANLQIGNADAPGGSGVVTASTPRVVLATDVALPSGENHIGTVAGNIANPSANFTRPSDTTAYASGDLVANSTAAGSVTAMQFTAARVAAGSFMLRRAKLHKSGTNTTNSIFRLHLFRAEPTPANGDNGAFSTDGVADYIGAFDATVDRAFTDGASGSGLPVTGSDMSIELASGQIIYGLIEARGAYTPASAEVFTATLEVIQN